MSPPPIHLPLFYVPPFSTKSIIDQKWFNRWTKLWNWMWIDGLIKEKEKKEGLFSFFWEREREGEREREREREREEQSSDNGELGLNRALTVDSSPPIEEEEPKTQRFDPGALPLLRRERCAIVFALAAGAAYLNNWLVWPFYWFAQGTMFRAFFVLGLYSCPLPWLVRFAFKPISGKQLADYFVFYMFNYMAFDWSAGELATELTTKTMDMLRTTNLGIL